VAHGDHGQVRQKRQPLAEVLEDLRRRYRGWLVEVYKDADPRFVVFELNERNEPRSI